MEEIKSQNLISKTEKEITLRLSGTTANKKYNSRIQRNFAMVCAVESNTSHINMQKLDPNYIPSLIPTENHVGAGLITYKPYYAIQCDQILQQKIEKSMQGKYKVTYDSPYGGTGGATETFTLRNLDKFLGSTHRWLMIKPVPANIDGTPSLKYYSTLSSEEFYGSEIPNIIRLFIDENKIERFLSMELSLIDVCLANCINMRTKK
jgi:hypothetical protein